MGLWLNLELPAPGEGLDFGSFALFGGVMKEPPVKKAEGSLPEKVNSRIIAIWRIKAMQEKRAFEVRKQAALDAAKEQGIVDVVVAGNEDGLSPEMVELAAKLIKKNKKTAYKRLRARVT